MVLNTLNSVRKNSTDRQNIKTTDFIRTAMDETIRILRDLNKDQKCAGKAERLHLGLQLFPKGSEAYNRLF